MRPVSTLLDLLDGASKVVVVGVGYEMGKDDGVGLEVARLVRGKSRLIEVFETYTAPENFTGAISDMKPSHVVFVDGAKMGLAPGESRVIDKSEIRDTSFSTHTMPLTMIMDYIEKRTGARCVMVGIEPAEFGFSEKREISPTSMMAAKQVARMILNSLDE